jgi:siroheme decarboxylase
MKPPVQAGEIDVIDLQLLDILQDDIPLVSDPWQILAELAGISKEETLDRLKRLADTGVLRGIAPTLESDSISPMVSTLIACRVPEDEIEQIAAVVNRYPAVSHNFRREHAYNLWFTLVAPSRDRMNAILEEIRTITHISSDNMLDLTTEQKYKIDVRFPILRNNKDTGRESDGYC